MQGRTNLYFFVPLSCIDARLSTPIPNSFRGNSPLKSNIRKGTECLSKGVGGFDQEFCHHGLCPPRRDVCPHRPLLHLNLLSINHRLRTSASTPIYSLYPCAEVEILIHNYLGLKSSMTYWPISMHRFPPCEILPKKNRDRLCDH